MVRRTSVLLGAVIAAIAAALWFGLNPSDEVPHTIAAENGEVERQPDQEAAVAPEDDRGLDEVIVAPAESALEVRQAASSETPAAWLSGSVRESSGSGVAGAELLLAPWSSYKMRWWEVDWDSAEAARAVADEAGRFGFESEPAGDRPLAGYGLWAFSPDHRAVVVHLPETREQPTDMVAKPSAPATVRVVDDAGDPVWAAEVHLMVAMPAPLRLASETNDDGVAEFPFLPGEVAAFATLDGERSDTWVGTLGGEPIELTLGTTFSAGGAVSLGPSAVQAPMTVRIRGAADDGLSALAMAEVDANGQWAADGIPYRAGQQYLFELQGESIPSMLETATPAGPGDFLGVDFDVPAVVPVVVRAKDANGEPIANALIRAWRMEEGQWTQNAAWTDDAGHARIHAIDEANLSIRCMKDGFSPQLFGPFNVPYQTKLGVDLVIPFTTRISGTVRRDGEPVEDFKICFAKAGTRDVTEEKFIGSEDGSFEIDSVPVGTLAVYAVRDGETNSDVLEVVTTEGQVSEVELELQEPAEARGVVVDMHTGEPISGVEVRGAITMRRMGIAPLDQIVYTDADGYFEGLLVNSNEAAVTLFVESHVDRTSPPVRATNGIADFGTIPLPPRRNLVVRFVGPPDIISNLRVELVNDVPNRPVPADGVVVFEDLRPRTYQLQYMPSEGSKAVRTQLDLTHIEDDDWEVEVDVTPADEVHVAVEGENLPELLWVSLTFVNSYGQRVSHWADMYSTGDADFFAVDTDHAMIQVMDFAGTTLAMQEADFSNGIQNPIVVPIPGTNHRVRVLDEEGDPVPEAWVRVLFDTDISHWEPFYQTDQQGLATLDGVQDGEYTVRIGLGGIDPSTYPLILSGGESETTLVLERDATLTMRATAAGNPVQGYECLLNHGHAQGPAARLTGDAEGIARLEGLQEGEYEARIFAPGIFQGPYSVRATTDDHQSEVQCRRLGSLAVTIMNASGPVQGAALSLRCTSTGTDLEAWMQARMLATHPFVTGPTGVLEFTEVPEGSYEWSVHAPSGATSNGTVDVSPAGPTELEVSLAD